MAEVALTEAAMAEVEVAEAELAEAVLAEADGLSKLDRTRSGGGGNFLTPLSASVQNIKWWTQGWLETGSRWMEQEMAEMEWSEESSGGSRRRQRGKNRSRR